MTALALVLAGALAVACVLLAARPFLRDRRGRDEIREPTGPERERARLAEERDRALGAMKELEFDHRTGKVSDADYETQVGELRLAAAAALRALDEQGGRRAPASGRKRARA